jgi:hypothetical protein
MGLSSLAVVVAAPLLDTGTLPAQPDLLIPAPQGNDPTVIDTTEGTVHMIIGGGATPASPRGQRSTRRTTGCSSLG